MPVSNNRFPKISYVIKGFLQGERVSMGKSTMSSRSGVSVHQIEKLIARGFKGQELIDKVFSKILEQERVKRLFFFRPSERISAALTSMEARYG